MSKHINIDICDSNATNDDQINNVLQTFANTSTSVSWSMLDAVVNKMNKKQKTHSTKFSPREIDTILIRAGTEKLRKLGIFRTSFGPTYLPIVLTNPAFAAALAKAKTSRLGDISCDCGIDTPDDPSSTSFRKSKSRGENQFSDSKAYNAGKHNSKLSPHKINCPKWSTPGAGHLHSWRRGFEDDRKN